LTQQEKTGTETKIIIEGSRQKGTSRGAEHEEYERKIITKDDDATRILEETKREIRQKNRKAQKHNPVWEITARTQNNDSTYEDKELRFKDREDKNKKDENRFTLQPSKF
jgi:hypothetical protein